MYKRYIHVYIYTIYRTRRLRMDFERGMLGRWRSPKVITTLYKEPLSLIHSVRPLSGTFRSRTNTKRSPTRWKALKRSLRPATIIAAGSCLHGSAPPSSNLKTKNKACLAPWCPQCHSWHSNGLHHASGTPRPHHSAPVPGAAQAWAATGVVTLSFCHLWEVSSQRPRVNGEVERKHEQNTPRMIDHLCLFYANRPCFFFKVWTRTAIALHHCENASRQTAIDCPGSCVSYFPGIFLFSQTATGGLRPWYVWDKNVGIQLDREVF